MGIIHLPMAALSTWACIGTVGAASGLVRFLIFTTPIKNREHIKNSGILVGVLV